MCFFIQNMASVLGIVKKRSVIRILSFSAFVDDEDL